MFADRLTRLVNANIETEWTVLYCNGGYTVVSRGKSRELYLEENKGHFAACGRFPAQNEYPGKRNNKRVDGFNRQAGGTERRKGFNNQRL